MTKINFKKVADRLKSAGVMAGGSVASNYLGGTINNWSKGKATPVINAGIRLGVGALLPAFLGEKKQGFITDFANGMCSEAAVSLARALKVPGVSGTDMDDPISGYVVTGTDIDTPVAGTSN
ncbi:MAG: hypothetical protein ACOYKE_02460 [Ferruginibacter sp.]